MKRKLAAIGMAFCLMTGTVSAMGIEAAAAEAATVTGTVRSGTTSDLLLLSTKEGNMEIKLDSGTDTSGCKFLLPGNQISVTVTHGSDEYLHATKLSGSTTVTGVTVDTSNVSTVSGSVSEKTKDGLLVLKTAQGEMEIKLDTSTDMSGCRVLVAGKTYSVAVARGSDAYMHAVSISDSAAASSSAAAAAGLTPAPSGTVTAQLTTVTGTVGDKTKDTLLYLVTSDGTMELVIDSYTDSRNGMVLTPGRSLTVTCYRGSDAYMHAASISTTKTYGGLVTIDTNTSTVTGTIGSKSTENMLYLTTQQGDMELKLDAVRSVTNCKVLVEGSKVSIVCARGNDAYMHALEIKGA